MTTPIYPGGGRTPPNPPSGGGGGGGVTGGGTGTVNTFVPFLENGGFAATAFYLFIPAQSAESGPSYIGTFAPTNWDDQANGSSYSYRMEDITPGRQPTVRRVILIYRDLGPATLTVTLTGTNDNNQVISASQVIKLGTIRATQALLTAFVDITLTAFRPQLGYIRAAGAGPVSIVRAGMIGEIEEVTL